MAVAFWHSKTLFDRCEIFFASGAGLSSALTAALPPAHKQIPAIVTAAFASLVGFSKWRSKAIESYENSARIERENNERDAWSKTLSRLKAENEAEKQGALEEIASFREKFDNQLKVAIGVILEDFHEKYFRGEHEEERHKHRTILFTCVESGSDDTRQKRLVVYARVGVHKESRSTWLVDDNDLEKCRGVAGKIWFHGAAIVTSTDLDWPPDESSSLQRAAYATSLGITMAEAEALNVKSTVFTGARIMAGGKKWGVLLLDSMKDGYITDKSGKKLLLGQCASLISAIVARMEA